MWLFRRLLMAVPTSVRQEVSATQVQKDFMKKAENWNRERVLARKQLLRANILVGGAIACTVLAIYGYSMWAVSQETFLDDLNEPEREEVA
ncbi:cytochrome c oxidase assembly factor 3, mitochondrial-like [Paramacrobiotus metropolitanus]|uniref:cytochrome c oxidase assembly factor 3, mitochondrial-like n=1 Tax=Paramacrobiotus metropolitanus TaxID=2943436 RepID=UPI002445FB70|nr:cytochrome c oxidase assembly factor 3, mitochondrial-like [Paramacrobiotus metropolitanus]